MRLRTRCRGLAAAALLCAAAPAFAQDPDPSVARQWNEELLEAIRNDFARPTVHARNLFHTSVAMWDAWAAFDAGAATYLHHETATAADVDAAREEALSFAAYRILSTRFANSPGADDTLPALDARMVDLGYDRTFTSTVGTSPAALGNRIARTVLTFGAADGANEQFDYANLAYQPVNSALLPAFPGNPNLRDPNRWQPLALEFFIDQSGNPFPTGTPPFLGPEWGAVTPFALSESDRTVYERGGFEYVVYHDPGPPPLLGDAGDAEYRAGFEQVVAWSGLLDPTDGSMLDIGPGARGNNTLGTNDGTGHATNPSTGMPYAPVPVPAGDYYRVLAEFWADGPDSETPPGHWFVLANYVSDHPATVRRLAGEGPELDRLEWDVKLYFALGGAMHDAAVAAWGVKGWYDYIRPVSAIRYMADRGQSSDPFGPSYHPEGITLQPGVIELVTAESIAQGARHEHLAGDDDENVGKIAVYAWRGPDFISDPATTTAGVGWILAENWWPYQRPSFVTPPFAGYVSGHSTYSRAAAALLTAFTGDAYFPGGLGEFSAPRNEFLVFEDGPSVDVNLQWATYADAADECSLSRIYGGIHPRADDIPGRLMGARIGPAAFAKAMSCFAPHASVSINRAKARRRGKRRGLITFRGTLVTGQHGPIDHVDVSQGLTVTVRYAGSMDGPGNVLESGTIAPGQCRVRRNGRIRARSDALTVRMRPVADEPGTYRFHVRLRVPDFQEPDAGTLTVEFHDANAVRTGVAPDCFLRNGRPRLRCEE